MALALAFVMLVILFVVLSNVPSSGYHERVIAPIQAQYAPLNITMKDSQYFDGSGKYWEYAQICMLIEVAPQSGGISQRKIVLVVGDDDGGSFRFIGEFASMQQCKNRFNRG
jgi:hypothetical protein